MLWISSFLVGCAAASGSVPLATSEVTKSHTEPYPATCREDDRYIMALKRRMSDTSISVDLVAENLKLHQSLLDMFHPQEDEGVCAQARRALTADIERLSTASIIYLDQAQKFLRLHERRCGNEKMVVMMEAPSKREYVAASLEAALACLGYLAASDEARAASLKTVVKCKSGLGKADAAEA